MPNLSDRSYAEFLNGLKQHIRSAQVKAALAVNQELILLYWQIGRDILARQEKEGWGTKVVERLAKDLKREFPEMKGLSLRNLKYMRAFAEAWPDKQIVQRCAAQIPWRHNQVLLEKVKAPEERLWYAQQSFEDGWSRDVLVMQIESKLHQRIGGAITNFEQSLPTPQSDLAQQLLKSEYNLEFLNATQDIQERELEKALVNHMRDFLLELGMGFSFMGSQYRLEVEGEEFFVDLLFYHIRLRCFVVIELKATDFKPEHSGQINFYVNAIDAQLKHPDDQPTIGIVLCRGKKKTIVEYALQGMTQPIGVATYKLQSKLPPTLEGNLPAPEQLEAEFSTALREIEGKQE